VAVLGLEERQGFVVATKLAVIDVADLSAGFPALLLASPHPHEDSDIEVSLQAEQRLNVLALSAGS